MASTALLQYLQGQMTFDEYQAALQAEGQSNLPSEAEILGAQQVVTQASGVPPRVTQPHGVIQSTIVAPTPMETQVSGAQVTGAVQMQPAGMMQAPRVPQTSGMIPTIGMTQGHPMGVTQGHPMGVTQGHPVLTKLSHVPQTVVTPQPDMPQPRTIAGPSSRSQMSTVSQSQIAGVVQPGLASQPHRVTETGSSLVTQSGAVMEVSEVTLSQPPMPQAVFTTLTPFQTGTSGAGDQSSSQGGSDATATSSKDQLVMQYASGLLSFEEFEELWQEEQQEDVVLDDIGAQATVADTQDEEDEEGMDEDEEKKEERPRRLPRAKPKRRSKLSPELLALMGEANLTYARGQTQDAIKMIMEIIRRVPSASEPYRTLAMIHEEMGDAKSYLQYATIAAHLGAEGVDEWLRLAELTLAQGNMSGTITCFTKAIRMRPRTWELYERRSQLYEKAGDVKRGMDDRRQMALWLPEERGAEAADVTREIAEKFRELGETSRSAEALESFITHRPGDATIEDVNFLLEYILCDKNYSGAIKALVQHCGVVVVLTSGESATGSEAVECLADHDAIDRFEVAGELHIDLQAKLLTSAIHAGLHQAVKDLVAAVGELDLEEYGDVMFDVSEAYHDAGLLRDARAILGRLVTSTTYATAAVWLRYGDCLSALGQLSLAAEAYRTVVSLAPGHCGARLSLSAALQQLGESGAAAEALGEEEEDVMSDPSAIGLKEVKLLVQRCLLFAALGKTQPMIKACKRLLFAGFWDLSRPDLANVVTRYHNFKNRSDAFKKLLENKTKEKGGRGRKSRY